MIPVWLAIRAVLPGLFEVARRMCLPDAIHLKVARSEVYWLEHELSGTAHAGGGSSGSLGGNRCLLVRFVSCLSK